MEEILKQFEEKFEEWTVYKVGSPAGLKVKALIKKAYLQGAKDKEVEIEELIVLKRRERMNKKHKSAESQAEPCYWCTIDQGYAIGLEELLETLK